MMRGYMARLGSFTFSMDSASFQELQRSVSYRWSGINRIGRQPSQQFTGQGDDVIRLRGAIYPHFRGGLGQIAALRQQAARGEKMPMVYADTQAGQFVGNFCIKDIEETRTVFFRDGTPRKIDFSLSLIAYGDDTDEWVVTQTGFVRTNIAKINASKNLFPSITGNAVLDQAFHKATGLASELSPAAGKLLTNLGTQLVTVQGFMDDLGGQFLPVKNAIIEGIDAATGIKGAGATALVLIGEVPQAQRIINGCQAISDEVARGAAIATRSSSALNTAYGNINTSESPADLVSSMRSATRSIGSLAKLCTDTSIASLRIKEAVS
jgi:phage protein U